MTSTTISGDSTGMVPVKKKRNLPGMPDPDAEVIALSPKTLLATNRFICEICNKGFQRDQNLQLHRRGHNLPWKLKQRNGGEPRKKVYVCPEPNCVHHDPSRALGDLTGIKKHFCRKHGDKKWKCDKCAKKYAVMSDWKAHSKTCGTREYRCDCGTLFSRRDSFITHRAFCDALAEESARASPLQVPSPPSPLEGIAVEESGKGGEDVGEGNGLTIGAAVCMPPPLPMVTVVASPRELENPSALLEYMPPQPITNSCSYTSSCVSRSSTSCSSSSNFLFSSILTAAAPITAADNGKFSSDLVGSMSQNDRPLNDSTSLCLSTNGPASLFSPPQRQFTAPPLVLSSPHMSATALLQKAAQMGPAGSGSSFLNGFGLENTLGHQETVEDSSSLQWRSQRQQIEPPEPPPLLSAGLSLGLPYEPALMTGSDLFGSKPATLDFLGLGMGPIAGSANSQLLAFITSMGASVDVASGSGARGPFGGGASPGRAWES